LTGSESFGGASSLEGLKRKMDTTMRVHTIATNHVERIVTHENEEARAMVAELEVELMGTGDGTGTLSLHFSSQAKIAAAKKLFKQGEFVTLTIGPAKHEEHEPAEKPAHTPA
jgi:hypothetical protein